MPEGRSQQRPSADLLSDLAEISALAAQLTVDSHAEDFDTG